MGCFDDIFQGAEDLGFDELTEPPPQQPSQVVAAVHLAALSVQAVTSNLDDCRASWSPTVPPSRADRFAVGLARLGLLPLGCVSILGATGGSMKTTVIAHVALSIAVGQSVAGLPTCEGAAMLVSLEDSGEEMSRKLGAITTTQFSPALYSQLMNRVLVLDLAGDARGQLTARSAGGVARTATGDAIIESCRLHAERCGVPVRMIAVDHARLAAGGDLNDSEAASALTRELSRIASATGAAVVLLCHSPKSSLSVNRPEEYSAADVLGSGAITDNARFAAVIFPLHASERKRFGLDAEAARSMLALRIVKSNYSEAGRVYYFRKRPVEDWGCVVPDFVDLAPSPTARATNANDQLDGRVLRYVAARPGQLTKDALAKTCAGDDGPLSAGRPAIAASVKRLLDSGRVATRTPTDQDFANGVSTRAKEVLYVPTNRT